MATFSASLDRDANRQTIQYDRAFKVSKTVAFDGTAGNGAVGSVSLFTVTGDILVTVVGMVTETLVGATSTLVVGTANNTAGLLASVSGPALVAGDVHTSGTSPADVAALSTAGSSAPAALNNGADIIATVGTADITDGTIKFYCLWRPLSTDGNVVAA